MSQQLRLVLMALVVLTVVSCGSKHKQPEQRKEPPPPTSIYQPADKVVKLKVTFVDHEWDGQYIPPGQQCYMYGGQGATPRIRVENIPEKANALILEFSNKTYGPLDYGGLGVLIYTFKQGSTSVVVPPAPGNSDNLPENFYSSAPHKEQKKYGGGVYLPPCSGGQAHYYELVVSAVFSAPLGNERILLGRAYVGLGRY